MKKIVLLIWCLLGVLCASASPFYSGYSQAPVAQMTSTSSMMRSANRQTTDCSYRVQGIQTSASYVTGGVTAGDTYARMSGRRKAGETPGVGGNPEVCYCEDSDGNHKCDHCGAYFDEFDGSCSNNPCWCPIDLDWNVMLFLTAAAGIYMLYKKTKKSRA